MTKSDPIATLIRLKWDEVERSSSEARRTTREELRAEYARRGTSASAGRWLDELKAEITAVEVGARRCLAELTSDDLIPDHARDDSFWEQLESFLPARAAARIQSATDTVLRDAETHGHLTGGLSIGALQLQSQHRANTTHDIQTRIRALRIQQELRTKRTSNNSAIEQRPMPDTKKVFIVHGRILEARRQMGIFIRSLGLEPINFDDLRATLGGTPTVADVIVRGMELAHGVVVLFTADEFAALRPSLRTNFDTDETTNRWQARPNVIFEAGMAFNRDRKRVVFVAFGSVGLFTDIDGIHILRPNNDPASHRGTLRSTLIGMGCAVDSSSSDWMTTGDFEAWIPSAEAGPSNTRQSAPVPDGDARIHLTGWLSNLPVGKSGDALSFVDIAAEARVATDQVHRLLQSVVDSSNTRWRVRELGTTVAILILEPLPPEPRRLHPITGGF